MNKIKKFASLLLALVMALALAAPAFAADTTITVPAGDNRTYDIYQIFVGDLDADKKLSNVKWGENGSGTTGEEVPEATLTAVSQISGDRDEMAAAIAEYVNFNSTAFKSGVKAGTPVSVPTGYYLIKDVTPANELPEGATLSLYVVEVVGPTEIKPKAGTVESNKEITGTRADDEEPMVVPANHNGVDVAIGDTVEFTLTAKLPDNYADFDSFLLVYHDVMSAGLTFENFVSLKLNGGDTNYLNAEGVTKLHDDEVTGCKVYNDCNVEVTIADVKTVMPDAKKGDTITVVYTAKLNGNAVVGILGNPNALKVEFSNDPNYKGSGEPGGPDDNPPTGVTPEHEVKVYTTELEIKKVDGTGAVLTGAEFTLTGEAINEVYVTGYEFVEDENGTYWKLADGSYTQDNPNDEGRNKDLYADLNKRYELKEINKVVEQTENVEIKAFVGTDGIAKFTGLKRGHYTLTESVTPSGYNTIKPVNFEVTFDDQAFTFSVTNAEGATVTIGANNSLLATEVMNQSGAQLPSTGGIGTTIFYVVGGVLAAGAVILLITKRRMNIEK